MPAEIELAANLIAKLTKENAKAIVEGLDIADFMQPDMKEIEVNGKRVWVYNNGSIITLMLPENSDFSIFYFSLIFLI